MRLSGKFRVCLFFLRKDFECTKKQIKPKPINKKLSKQKSIKARIFRAQKLLKGEKLVILCFLKKIKIVLITLFTLLVKICSF